MSQLCELCPKDPKVSKYRCSGCLKRYCSLECYKEHCFEGEGGCSGVRDVTKYVDYPEFDINLLVNDYQFIEAGIERKSSMLDKRKRGEHGDWLENPVKKRRKETVENKKESYRAVHKPCERFLQYRAQERNVWLRLMAPGMSKRKHNSTKYVNDSSKMYWRIDFVFEQCPDEAYKIQTIRQCDEEKSLLDALKFFLDGDSTISNSLRMYNSNYELFLRVADTVNLYHRLDEAKSVKENLDSKIIIEYPEIHVVLKTETSDWKVIDLQEGKKRYHDHVAYVNEKKIQRKVQQALVMEKREREGDGSNLTV